MSEDIVDVETHVFNGGEIKSAAGVDGQLQILVPSVSDGCEIAATQIISAAVLNLENRARHVAISHSY